MKIHTKFNLNKSPKNKNNKTILFIFILLINLSSGILYEAYGYSRLINNFKENFDQFKYSEANNLLITQQQFNPFKSLMLKRDISRYFNNKINILSTGLEDGSINSESALIELNEIYRYDMVSENIISLANSIDLIQSSINSYNDGISYFNNEQYNEAISSLKNVSSLDLNYANSLRYLNESKNKLKETLLNHCDNLVNSDYYTQALSELSDSSDVFGEDIDIQKKILEIKVRQQEYLNENSATAEASSSALVTTISPDTINKLNVQSSTSYFINVNLKNQKTYIYQGNADNWNLIKTFSCSTGIDGENTPSGSFSIKERGDWFFSEKYNQGGKYWTQITGDILFHSIPFSKDKTTVVDYTMNKPSSHGCIRLSIDDAKWIYNNIPRGSKVIIK